MSDELSRPFWFRDSEESVFPFPKKKKKPRINDSTFGSIDFSQGQWCSSLPLVGSDFFVIIDGPESGPSEIPRQLFRKICQDLTALKASASALMLKELHFPVASASFSICGRSRKRGRGLMAST
jgi:hypothetical protein